jgi:DNA-binding NarL/FixJ family response regulator
MKPAVLIVREQWFDPHHLDRIAHRRALLALRLALPSTAWMIGWQAPCEHALAAFSELRICGAIDYPPDLDTLSRAIQAVLAGQLWFSHDVLQVLCLHALDTRKRTAPRTTTLTPRERTVLALTHRGLSPREIGRTLGLSQGRVRLYLETALDKQALVQQP